MNTEIDLLIQAEVAAGRARLLYEIVGKFGDKLPKDIQTELYKMADAETKDFESKRKKVGKKLS